MNVRIVCPMASCTAVVEVVRELREPGATDLVDRIAEHVYDAPGTAGDGQVCPASLLDWPLTDRAVTLLTEGEMAMDRLQKPPAPSDADRWFGSGRPMPMEHSLTPHPAQDPRWFRGSLGAGSAMYRGRWR